jgi:MFS transporter, FSR family, fosmidomycin resistance protein
MYPTLFLVYLGHFLIDMTVGIWPLYKTLSGIDLRVASLVAGACGFLGEGMQLLFGYFCDRGKRKQVIIAGLLLSTAIFLLSFVKAPLSFFFIILSVMVGSGAFHPAAVGFIGGLSERNKGKIILGFALGGALGQGFSQIFYISLLYGHPARMAVVVCIIAIVCLTIGRFRSMKEPPSRKRLNLQEFLQPFKTKRRSLILLYFSQVFNQGLLLAFLFLLPDFLKEKACHSWLCHGGGLLCFLGGASLALMPAGMIIDRFGPKAMMITVCCLSSCLFYTLLFFPFESSWAIALLLTLFGACAWPINPTIVTWGNKLVPESPSFVSGLLMGMAWCVSHLIVIVSGILSTVWHHSTCHLGLGILGILMVTTIFFAIAMPKEESVMAIES